MSDLDEMLPKSRAEAVGAIASLAATLGRGQMATAQRHFATMAEVAMLKSIVESKSYKFLTRPVLAAIFPEKDPGTLPDCCETADDLWEVLGTSRQRVNDLVRNYDRLGETFMQRVQELGIGRPTLDLAVRLNGKGRKRALALARDPATDRKKLASEIRRLAKEGESLEEEKTSLEDQIEKGKGQLKKAQAEARGLKRRVSDYQAGRAMPPEDEEAVKEFAARSASVKGFFVRLRTHQWATDTDSRNKEDPLAISFAALVVDEAKLYFEDILQSHGELDLTSPRLKLVTQYAKIARQAADAVGTDAGKE